MDSLSPRESNEPSTPPRDAGSPEQCGAKTCGAVASAWHPIGGMPDEDDDCEKTACPDDDDNDSNVGDAEVVNNLALGVCVQ